MTRRPLLVLAIVAALAAGGGFVWWWLRVAAPGGQALVLVPARFADLAGWDDDDPRPALEALQRSCERLVRRPSDEPIGREPTFGRVANWRPVCEQVHERPADGAAARRLLEASLRPWLVTDRNRPEGLFTGYYEPSLAGARTVDGVHAHPIYRRPGDLVTVELGRFDPALEGRQIAGRVQASHLVPYYTRAEIDAGALRGRDLELLWAADPLAVFFLHIQGSGRVVLPDGTTVRVGYAAQNGHPYRAIGRDLVEMGALAREAVSMQSIRAWLEANADRAAEVMQRNPSYVFFRELDLPADAPGPPGAQGVPLTPGRSLAVDRRFLPLGVPIWLETRAPLFEGEAPLRRLVVAQDTGGAIRGPVRGDLFWGAGPEAEHAAGHMREPGRYWVLLPTGLDPSR